MRAARLGAVTVALAVVTSLTACTSKVPETVVAGTVITVGWSGSLTSTNAASSPTAGNRDIAEMIRSDFGDVVDGEFVADESFGAVTIVSQKPFTVRYDLTEPAWSDGVPLDAADLLLGWAGATGFLDRKQGAEAAVVPVLDEFARAIQVTDPQPKAQWQTAVRVPVAAHVVGRHAFGTDDPMVAKQAVITAIQHDDFAALARLATVWRESFAVSPDSGADDLGLSSGPYKVERLQQNEQGQTVSLVPNPAYRGALTPKVAHIELVPPGPQPLAELGDRLNVAQVAPRTSNRATIRDLERRDFNVETTHDGTVWAVLLRPSGVFDARRARAAFIRSTSAADLIEGGGGQWAGAYRATTAMTAAPGTKAYDIVSQDSGFSATLGAKSDDPAVERRRAGVADGARVCVLFDRKSAFAKGAFAALKQTTKEAGWAVADCGSNDFAKAVKGKGWNAVVTRVPIPQTPDQLAAQWGSTGSRRVVQVPNKGRDALIAQLAETVDVYESRVVLAKVEATIVKDAVALPLAVNPRLTVIDRRVSGVAPRNGAEASLTYSVAQWEAVQ